MIVMTSTRGLLIQELQVTWHLTRIFSSSLIQKSQKGYVLLADGVKKVQVEGKGSGFINYPANYVVLALCFKNPLTSYNVSILWCCGISTYYFPWEFAFLHSWWSLSVVFCLVLMISLFWMFLIGKEKTSTFRKIEISTDQVKLPL